MKDFAKLAIPLYRITGKQKFRWGQEEAGAFEEIKKALTTAPVLALPIIQTPLFLTQTRRTTL